MFWDVTPCSGGAYCLPPSSGRKTKSGKLQARSRHRTSWSGGNNLDWHLGRGCSVRSSSETPVILRFFLVFLSTPQSNSRVLPRVYHYRFLPCSSWFIRLLGVRLYIGVVKWRAKKAKKQAATSVNFYRTARRHTQERSTPHSWFNFQS